MFILNAYRYYNGAISAMNLRFSYKRFLTFDYETDAWQTILLSVNNHQRRRESKKGTSNKRGGGEPNTGE